MKPKFVSALSKSMLPAAAWMVLVTSIRVDFNSGANDNVTVWLNPNLSLTEAAQNPALMNLRGLRLSGRDLSAGILAPQ